MASRLGVDVGGTFTDLIFYDNETGETKVGKGPTVPQNPEIGVRNVIAATLTPEELASSDFFFHGTTVGINSIVERKGAKVGILTTEGFRDVLETRRTDRDEFYNMLWKADEPLVRRKLRMSVRERIRNDGEVLAPMVEEDVRKAAAGFIDDEVESVAVVFINSYADPTHELRAAELLRDAGFEGAISLSHQVTGEFREYERTSTTVIDAYVRPRMSSYLRELSASLRADAFTGDTFITRSGGGSLPFSEGERRPFETIMSGPVAGAAGSAELCRVLGLPLAVTADVGGTTFDTCMIVDHEPIVKYEGRVAGMPLQTTWVDVRSIGAGGGSIASEASGLLQVGPESAGADPGPVCYGKNGDKPTVTDAAATLGMLAFGELAGGVNLDIDSAREAIASLGQKLDLDAERTAQGVLEITAAAMANSIRAILEEVGEDPAEAAILAFGGAGPLFGTMIARELNARTVVIPNYAGNFSAWGMLLQEPSRSAARTFVARLDEAALEGAAQVVADLCADLESRIENSSPDDDRSVQVRTSFDLRYEGQEYFLTVDVPFQDGKFTATTEMLMESFANDYEQRYGHTLNSSVEIVAVRVVMTTALPKSDLLANTGRSTTEQPRRSVDAFSFETGKREAFEVVMRSDLALGRAEAGPMIILEETATTYVDVGFEVEIHDSGSLVLHNKMEAENV